MSSKPKCYADSRTDNGTSQSQYTSPPVTLRIGPGLKPFWVPEVLLQSLSKLPRSVQDNNSIHLTDVDVDIGHVIVHFLHTGQYRTLDGWHSDNTTEQRTSAQAKQGFKKALRAFAAAKKYELAALQDLAKVEIVHCSDEMSISHAVHAIGKDTFGDFMDDAGWLQDVVLAKIDVAFAQDDAVFSTPSFFSNVKSLKMAKLIGQRVAELYSRRVSELNLIISDVEAQLDGPIMDTLKTFESLRTVEAAHGESGREASDCEEIKGGWDVTGVTDIGERKRCVGEKTGSSSSSLLNPGLDSGAVSASLTDLAAEAGQVNGTAVDASEPGLVVAQAVDNCDIADDVSGLSPGSSSRKGKERAIEKAEDVISQTDQRVEDAVEVEVEVLPGWVSISPIEKNRTDSEQDLATVPVAVVEPSLDLAVEGERDPGLVEPPVTNKEEGGVHPPTKAPVMSEATLIAHFAAQTGPFVGMTLKRRLARMKKELKAVAASQTKNAGGVSIPELVERQGDIPCAAPISTGTEAQASESFAGPSDEEKKKELQQKLSPNAGGQGSSSSTTSALTAAQTQVRDLFIGLSKSQRKKLQKKLDEEAAAKCNEDMTSIQESEIATGSDLIEQEPASAVDMSTSDDELCPFRFVHLSQNDGWRNCKQCERSMRQIAVKLHSVGMPDVNGLIAM